ncbi:MAG: nuclear transport factor 2 family protein [Candidatus Binatia bacterium]
MTPQETTDVIEIQQLLHRYSWAVDHRELTLLDTVFAPDATIHYNVVGGTKLPYTELRAWLPTALQRFRITQHCMVNPMIDVSGDTARARTYGLLMHAQEYFDGTTNYVIMHAIYFDALVRTPAGWRIVSRRLDNMWTQGEMELAEKVKSFPTPVPG